ncbi:hypothetical protein LTR37_010206 [Vermiconidia calcicola]|uniref:Uncharacterized protein n=1 Tax=Vermiconidia calcicola TaxID=1690605 RepID=A0ACC3N5R3_9PEZI|nr:hypothetical protein LTR37_010206 [Vermiconidia calcicola]
MVQASIPDFRGPSSFYTQNVQDTGLQQPTMNSTAGTSGDPMNNYRDPSTTNDGLASGAAGETALSGRPFNGRFMSNLHANTPGAPPSLMRDMQASMPDLGGPNSYGVHNFGLQQPTTTNMQHPQPHVLPSITTNAIMQAGETSMGADAPGDFARPRVIRLNRFYLLVPEFCILDGRLARDTPQYIPRIQQVINVRIGPHGEFSALRVSPRVLVGELLDDFVPIVPGSTQNRRVWVARSEGPRMNTVVEFPPNDTTISIETLSQRVLGPLQLTFLEQ